MGDKGEEVWRELMDGLFLAENYNTFDPALREKRKNLYPKTLAEGRKYFLSHGPKNIDV